MPYKDPQKNKECIKKYHQEHREELNEYNKKWRKKNPKRANAICKKYRDSHKKERHIVCTNWTKNNPDKVRIIRKRATQKKRATPKGNLDHRMEVAIWQSLKKNKAGHKWEKLVEYTVDDLKKHLEKQFKNGFTWEKFFKERYEIDHIKPKSLFNFTYPEDREFKECWALDNLQPLEKIANLKKSNHYNATTKN